MFALITLLAEPWWEIHRADEHITCSTNLFKRSSLGIADDFRVTQLMPNSSAEQLSQDRHDQVAMDTDPTATLEVIPTKFLFGFAKASFHSPVSKRDS